MSPARREPTPAYLSTPEQFLTAIATVVALLAIIMPWQLDVSGPALWLPVLLGAITLVVTWTAVVRLLVRRSADPNATPPPQVSRRRSLIASVALLVGAIAVTIRLLVY